MHHASRVMLNLIQHPLINQGIPNQVRNDVLTLTFLH